MQDLRSIGGTFVNRIKVSPNAPVLLADGDSIRIGPYKLRFHDENKHRNRQTLDQLAALAIDDDQQSSIQKSVLTSGYGLASVRPEDKLNGILKINEALAGNVDLHAICPRVLETLFEIFPQADRGAILLLHGEENELQPVTHRHRQPGDSAPVRISRTILNNVLSECSAILSENTALDPRVTDSESLSAQTVRSTMCAPMQGVDGKPFGVVSLDSQDPRKQFSSDDLHLLVAVASQASHAFENARLMKV